MEIPVLAIRDYIKNAINIVINVERLSDGRRKITSINEITGIDENKEITLHEIFSFNQTGLTLNNEVIGEFKLHNYKPIVYEKIRSRGFTELDSIFKDINKQNNNNQNNNKNNNKKKNK